MSKPDAQPELGEADAVRDRYAKRATLDWRYHKLNPSRILAVQERERQIAQFLRQRGWQDVGGLRVTDVGSGGGGNLLLLLRMGFSADLLTGLELLEERHHEARAALPETVRLLLGDAMQADVAPLSQDIVMQNLVFSSLLDDAFQQTLARRMWSWVRPGGAILWHDFTMDNRRNRDVRGVPLRRVRELFPEGRMTSQKVTLAPPIARAVAEHPVVYSALHAISLLRTHALVWIEKS